MTHTEKQLDSVCAFITKAEGRCLFCGGTLDLENHHIFFGNIWKKIWFFRWTLEFQICLCKKCHKHEKFSPHNQKSTLPFWLKLEEKLLLKDHDKYNTIIYWRYNRKKVPIPEQPDLRELLKERRKQAARIEKTSYMDYLDEVYQGRNEQNQPIF